MISIHPMYSAGQITWATILGGPLGGGWLLALNYKRLAQPGTARAVIVLSVVATAVLLAIAFLTPDRSMSWLPIIPVIAMRSLAKSLQGPAYARHVAVGGSVGSSWRTTGVGLACAAISLGVALGVVAIHAYATTPDKVVIGNSDVRYTGGATRAEAQTVGDALMALGYFRPGAAATAQLTLDRGRHVVELVVQDFVFSDEKIHLTFHELADELSRRAFEGAQVDIWLTDDDLEPHVKLRWEVRPRSIDLGDQHTVKYQQGGTEAEARGAAKVIQDQGTLPAGRAATVIVKTVSSRHVVAFVIDNAGFDNSAAKTVFHKLAEPLSKAAFSGKPVDVWLEDADGVAHVKLSWEDRPK